MSVPLETGAEEWRGPMIRLRPSRPSHIPMIPATEHTRWPARTAKRLRRAIKSAAVPWRFAARSVLSSAWTRHRQSCPDRVSRGTARRCDCAGAALRRRRTSSTAPAHQPLNLLVHFHLRQHIALAGHPHIQRRKQEDAHQQVGDQTAYYHDSEGPLRVGADIVRQRRGQ